MELLFNEQDVVDSVCVFTAAKEGTNPENVDVNLVFEPSYGFSASANVGGRARNLNEQDLVDAIVVYLRDYHNFYPDQLRVELLYKEHEGIIASIQVR